MRIERYRSDDSVRRRERELALDNREKLEMLCPMGEDVAAGWPYEEIEADPRESAFELPPVDHAPFADNAEKKRAVHRVIEQAERERAAEAAREKNNG